VDGNGVVANVGEEGGGCEGAKVGGDSAGVALGVFAAAFAGGRLGRHFIFGGCSCCYIRWMCC